MSHHCLYLIAFRAPHASQVILELIQSDRGEADQILLIHQELAGPANQEYQGLSPYQRDLRTSFPSGHLDHLKGPHQLGEISMQKVMLSHH